MTTTPSPNPGSFWDRPGIHYVLVDGLILGQVSRVARNRFKWVRYASPPKVTTKSKTQPKVAETHTVPMFNRAIWAVKLSYNNATK